MNFTLTLDEVDTLILIKALDLYARLGTGQIEEVKELFRDTMPIDNMDEALQLLLEAKLLMTGIHGRGSHGIANPEVGLGTQRAYEICDTLRHSMVLNAPATPSYSVYFREPLPLTGKAFPKVTIEE